jgi:hypothetical protein
LTRRDAANRFGFSIPASFILRGDNAIRYLSAVVLAHVPSPQDAGEELQVKFLSDSGENSLRY